MVRGSPEVRFHQGSTRVPPGFHQGCTRVPPGFLQGFTRVPRGLQGGASTKKSTASCWGYHLSFCLISWDGKAEQEGLQVFWWLGVLGGADRKGCPVGGVGGGVFPGFCLKEPSRYPQTDTDLFLSQADGWICEAKGGGLYLRL